MRRRFLPIVLCCVAVVCGASPARAFEPELPTTARLTAERASAPDSFEAPIAVFDGAGVPTVALEGAIQRKAWRINAPGLTTLQILIPLREQLEAAGFDVHLECDAASCGGFDFRFDIEVLPGPNMYVNISRFRYLTALQGDPQAPSAAVGVLVSVTAGSAYVQVITADTGFDGPIDIERENPVAGPVEEIMAPGEGIESVLFDRGRVILEDLDFAIGSTDLGDGPYTSLAELAAILEARPTLRIALVGHTDTVGGLETNITVSRARAQSVRDRLISSFGADAARLDAEGMGYLSPIASNLTEEGRAQNRRVEVILVREE